VIDIDFAFLIQAINFGILLLVLNILLYKPIRKVLAERQAEIAGAQARTAEVDRDVQEKMALYEARLSEVKAQAAAEREALRKAAQAEESELLDKARKEATDSLAAIKERMAKEAADAKVLLQGQAQLLSLEICEKVLGRSL